MAPRPKPTALKNLSGRSHHKENDAEPQLPDWMPECPKQLWGEARDEWYRVCDGLHQAGLLKQVDRAALAAYCQAWARWIEAEKQLKPKRIYYEDETKKRRWKLVDQMVLFTEKGYAYQSPWVGVANSALEEMRKFMTEFGMTPASRSRIRVEKPQEVDPFEEFVKQRLGDT